jgi:hypothetical protein
MNATGNLRAPIVAHVEMGRGLSPLQIDILKIAYRNWCEDRMPRPGPRMQPDPIWIDIGRSMMANIQAQIARGEIVPFEHPDLYTYEVLSTHFGFPLRPGVIFVDRESNNWNFDRNRIDKKRYSSACASVSRAFRRLKERGLAQRVQPKNYNWSGIKLTEAGLELAKQLSVKTLSQYESINR